MTVGIATPRDEYVEDGATTIHNITFSFINSDEISVSRILVDGTEILLVEPTHYTVSGGAGGVGFITKTNGGIAGATLQIDRKTPIDQLTHYEPGDDFPAESHEAALDKLTRIVQEIVRDLLTREDVRDLVGALLVAGDGIAIGVDDPGNKITISSLINEEFIADAIADTLEAGPGVTLTYDDVLGKLLITADLANIPDCVELSGDQQSGAGGGGGGGSSLTGEQVMDVIAAMLSAGTGIEIAYNDAGDQLTISNTAPATAGYTDENARDAIGAALHAGNLIAIAVDDAGDTITISCSALDPIYRGLSVTTKAAAFDFADAMGGKSILYTGGPASATLRLQANVALSDGWGTVIRNIGTGTLTIALEGATHLYINGATASAAASIAVGGVATINRWAADEFTIVGPKVN